MFLNRLKSAAWHVAYRQMPEGSILDDKHTPFVEIENNWPYCSAMDPFVFEYSGETYVFAELYDLLEGHGVIGYSKWTDGRFSNWQTVIKEDYHLSYPFIYTDEKGDVHIIPESFQDRSVYSYRATCFPEKWVREDNLISDVEYVDTTLLDTSEGHFAFTYDIAVAPKELLLYRLQNGYIVTNDKKCICTDDSVARPGGRFLRYHDNLIRVSQDCLESYGHGIVFSKVCQDFWNEYHEERVGYFGVRELWSSSKLTSLGVHTYNATGKFEVIDIKNTRFSPLELLLRVKRKVNKYIN